jgi:serine/threonine protein kinase
MIEHSKYDYKADIWTLGCCLSELCSGRKPFKGESLKDLIDSIVNRES